MAGKTVILTLTGDTYVPDTVVPPTLGTDAGTESGNNTASSSWAVAHPAVAAGDLVIIGISWDDSTTTTDVTEPAGPNSEVLSEVNATPAVSSSTEVRCKVWWTIATDAWVAGSLTFTPSASEQWTAVVAVIPAGDFDAADPIGASTTHASAGSETAVLSAAFTAGATDGDGRLFCWTAVDADPQTLAADWTQVANQDRGAVSGGLFSRDAAVTDSESIAEDTVSTIAGNTWCSVSFIVRAPATSLFEDARAAMRDGMVSAQSEAAGFNALRSTIIPLANITRTADDVLTIVFAAAASYDITAQEVITPTIPASILSGGVAIVATPTFTIDPDGGVEEGDGSASGSATSVAAGKSAATAPGISTSAATATAVGRSTALVAAVAGGQATAVAVGRSSFLGEALAAGLATAAGVAFAIASAAAASTGSATVTGVGRSTVVAVGASTAGATAVAVGQAASSAVAQSAGSATVTAPGVALFVGIGSASGSATVDGVVETGASVGAASGFATVTAVGLSSASAVGASTGSATVVGSGAGTASAAGAATATAIGRSTASAVASASGSAPSAAIGLSTATGAGSAAGTATAASVGSSSASAVGTGAGSSTALGVGQGLSVGVGSVSAGATVTAVGQALSVTVGTSAGSASVVGLSGVQDGVAAAAGSSAVQAVGRSTTAAVGVSSGSSTAAGWVPVPVVMAVSDALVTTMSLTDADVTAMAISDALVTAESVSDTFGVAG